MILASSIQEHGMLILFLRVNIIIYLRNYFLLPFKKIFFYLKVGVTERRQVLLHCSHDRNSWAELKPGASLAPCTWGQGPQGMGPSSRRPHARSWTRRGAAGTETSVHMRCRHCRWRLRLPHHGAGHRCAVFFLPSLLLSELTSSIKGTRCAVMLFIKSCIAVLCFFFHRSLCSHIFCQMRPNLIKNRRFHATRGRRREAAPLEDCFFKCFVLSVNSVFSGEKYRCVLLCQVAFYSLTDYKVYGAWNNFHNL